MKRRTRSISLATAAIVIAVAIGAAAGIGGYTFIYAEGASYLTDDPAACANCHVMQEQYDAWLKSPHRHVAGCNGCHTPDGFIAKYYTKALNGWNHSLAFTTGEFHEPITINERNLAIVEQRCRDCHAPIVEAIDPVHTGQEMSCVRCHSDVGHW
jgi:cytochrome c nitrite reductase small subunit